LRGFFGLDAATENDIATTAVDPTDRILLTRLYAVLDELPASDRTAWVLHRVEGETLPEVARLCGCSLATVKRRIERSQRAIEAQLS
jgi:RNA polymerase sigma-70 factor (ECF subfamily)